MLVWGTLDRRFQWHVCKTVEHDTTSIKWKFFMPWKMKMIIAWYNFSHFKLYNWRIIVFMCLQERKLNFCSNGSQSKSLVWSCLVLSCHVLSCDNNYDQHTTTVPPCVLLYILRGTSSRTLFFYDIYVHEEIMLQ